VVLAIGLITGIAALSAALADWSTARLDRSTTTLVVLSEAAKDALLEERAQGDDLPSSATDQAFTALADYAADHPVDLSSTAPSSQAAAIKAFLDAPTQALAESRLLSANGHTELLDDLDLVSGQAMASLAGPSLKNSPEVRNFVALVSNYPSREALSQDMRANALTRVDHAVDSLTRTAQGRSVTLAVVTALLAAGTVLTTWRWWRSRSSREARHAEPLGQRLSTRWQHFTGKQDDYDQLPEAKLIGPPGLGAASRPAMAAQAPASATAVTKPKPAAQTVAAKSTSQANRPAATRPTEPKRTAPAQARPATPKPTVADRPAPKPAPPATTQLPIQTQAAIGWLTAPPQSRRPAAAAVSNSGPVRQSPATRPTPWGTTALPQTAPPGAAQTHIAQVMSEALAQVSRPHQVRWSIRSQVTLPAGLTPRLAQVVAALIDVATAKNPALVVLVTVNTAGAVLYVTVSDRAAAGPDGPFGLGHRTRSINAVAERMGATLAARAGPGGRGSDVTIALPIPAVPLLSPKTTAPASVAGTPDDPWHNLVRQARTVGTNDRSPAVFG